MTATEQPHPRLSSGIAGIDTVLRGGLPAGRVYLVQGPTGTGKTTLAFQFLLEGMRRGEKSLYITLLQSRLELEDIARSHGWCLDALDILELPSELGESAESEQTVFSPANVELCEAVDAILAGIDEYKPVRVVLDSVSELAILVDSQYQLRRQILRLKHKLSEHFCTSMLITGNPGDATVALQTLAHGTFSLDRVTPVYGMPRRQLEITKMRGMDYSAGIHDFCIRPGGIIVFPRLEVPDDSRTGTGEPVSSGVQQLDDMLGGGLETGTTCLITGTAGAGKSTLASFYATAAASRGEKSAVFCFDERRATFLERARQLTQGLPAYVEQGLVELRQMDVGSMSPGEFIQEVVHCVDKNEVSIVVIDSLTGYLNAMPDARLLKTQLHELLAYLSSKNVLTIMILAMQGLFSKEQEMDASYLPDSVLLARHFEADGQLKRCLSIVKKRYGGYDNSIREFNIQPGGIDLGRKLEGYTGVLTGVGRSDGYRSDSQQD